MSRAPRVGMLLGDQLSWHLPLFAQLDPAHDCLLLAEVQEEASHVPHHPYKLIMLFSAMRHFAQALRERGWRVRYVHLDDPQNTGSLAGELARALREEGAGQAHLCETGDWRVEQSLREAGLPLHWHADTRFFCSREQFAAWAAGKRQLRMEFFYRQMRREQGLLMNGDGTPVGGAWNFDKDNRKPLGRHSKPPLPLYFSADAITQAVQALVEQRFAAHYGRLHGFAHAVTHAQAEQLWQYFLDNGLAAFGDYQDAMASDEPFLFHARISAALNIGLLDVRQLCRDVEAAYWQGRVPLNAAEGFIRQLLGWREYVRGIYWLLMPEYAQRNALGNQRALPAFYWSGQTQMNCMRQTIGQTLEHAYAHHIQRLMITGNFALLAGIQPQQLCDWYLAVYMDAFDWVELPNTLGMVLHADGGYLGSKPYCASGQYIKRMSDYCSGCRYQVSRSTDEQACPFNALYWHFLMRHQAQLSVNPRLAMPYRNLARMAEGQREALWARGEQLLARLDRGEML